MIANAQCEIQIVDTHESLETLINVDVAAGTSQFNRTLVNLFWKQLSRQGRSRRSAHPADHVMRLQEPHETKMV